jgi:hypothetical protein
MRLSKADAGIGGDMEEGDDIAPTGSKERNLL